MNQVPILAEVTRGPLVESIHRGVLAVVDNQGNLVARAGDPRRVTFMRSAAKPIQAIPLVEEGGLETLGLGDEHLAVMTASHSGEEIHRKAVAEILAAAGYVEDDLHCGIQAPFSRQVAQALAAEGKPLTPIYNNCSGKHSGMLALAKKNRWDKAEYLSPGHPVQRRMVVTLGEFVDMTADRIAIGIDGCGVPVFGLPVDKMAQAFARLVNPPGDWPEERVEACRRVVGAMQGHPLMVAGTGRICTDLMAACDDVVAKVGAEGIYCVGVKSKGWGLACKVEDGNQRALGPIVVEALRQLGVLGEAELAKLEKHRRVPVKNAHKQVVGEIRPAFTLEWS